MADFKIKSKTFIALCLLVFAGKIPSSAASEPFEDVLSLEREGLKKAYQYEREARSYDKPKAIRSYKPEAKELTENSSARINPYKREADKLQRKSFEQVKKYVKENKLFEGAESLGIDEGQRRLVFISLSQNRSNLDAIIKQAKIYRFTPIMRGFRNGSYLSTANFLSEVMEKADHGVVIDPESFKEFDVRVVPTFVVAAARTECLENQSCAPSEFNKVAGNVSFDYVLRLFNESGDKL